MADSTAKRLIEKHGRAVTVRYKASTANVDEPWKTDTQEDTDAATFAVFYPVERKFVDGSTVFTTDLQVYIAGDAVIAAPAAGDVLIDDTAKYRVVKVEHLRPGLDDRLFTVIARMV